MPIAEARETAGKLYLRFPLGKDFLLEHLRPVLAAHRGKTPVYIHVEETKRTAVAPRELWVELSDGLKEEIGAVIGAENVAVKQ